MAVLVNFKICDNADVCSGVEVCPTGAIFWDVDKQTLDTDNTKCTNCGACENACPAGAIIVAKNEDEQQRVKRRIEEDPRTIEGLFVERYGASPIDETLQIGIKELISLINSNEIVAVEVIDDSDTACLISSVPVSDIFGDIQHLYRKITTNDPDYSIFEKTYNITNIPALLILRHKDLILKIDGIVENNITEEREYLITRVRDTMRGIQ